jgi:pantoate--beta-alanine ligase
VITLTGIAEVRKAVMAARRGGAACVGLVPTMGALHAGHLSLIDAARARCDFVVVSIFVNPTQFGPREDFDKYPRSLEADVAGCVGRGVDLVFAPEVGEIYGAGAKTSVHVAGLSQVLCGAHRPGHFDGVCTVVLKLFNIVAPDVAYFGAKDYQQTAVIRKMVRDLDVRVGIEVCPTVREADGLAMSSRNANLSADERAQATALVESLRLAERMLAEGQTRAARIAQAMRAVLAEKAPLGAVDYVEIVDPTDLTGVEDVRAEAIAAVAVRFPSARLIDNVLLTRAADNDRRGAGRQARSKGEEV